MIHTIVTAIACACFGFLFFCLLDTIQHLRTIWIVAKEERHDEYFDRFTQDERQSLGAGFKLYRYFSKPKSFKDQQNQL